MDIVTECRRVRQCSGLRPDRRGSIPGDFGGALFEGFEVFRV
jgi:hypothetical protein